MESVLRTYRAKSPTVNPYILFRNSLRVIIVSLPCPDPRNGMLAEFAPAVRQMVFGDRITDALDQNVLAARAIGVVPGMPGDVPDTSVMKPFGLGDLPGHIQRGYGSGRKVL